MSTPPPETAPVVTATTAEPAAESSAAGPSVPHSTAEVKVFAPPSGHLTSSEVDDSFFEPTISDVQAYHNTMIGRSKQLNDAPLLTAKHREEAEAARRDKKAAKWPTTTIRVRFSDGTQIQSVFPSTSPIQDVYAFVRESLATTARTQPFTLYQPPRTMFPEHPVAVAPPKRKEINPKMKTHIVAPAGYTARGGPVAGMQGGSGGKESLSELGLVPQSVLMVKWEDQAMNGGEVPAPLTDELRAKVAPLPPPVTKAPEAAAARETGEKKKSLTGSAGEVKMPKWLQKGLMKKK